jgi:hypothetical protein
MKPERVVAKSEFLLFGGSFLMFRTSHTVVVDDIDLLTSRPSSRCL